MTITKFKKLLRELEENRIDAQIPEIRSTSEGTEAEAIELRFTIEWSGDDEGEDMLAEINAVLGVYGIEAGWTGNGNGDDMDAVASVPVEGARYEPYGFGTSKLVLE